MSPVAPSSGHASKALLLAAATILLGMAALWGASVVLTDRHNDRSAGRTSFGDIVTLGKAAKLADEIDEHRQPVFFPDVSGNHSRDLYLQHRGDDPKEGWSAFLVAVPDAPADCVWRWNDGRDRFDASCDPDRHAPADGEGLVRYPVAVRDGKVRVDLRSSSAVTT